MLGLDKNNAEKFYEVVEYIDSIGDYLPFFEKKKVLKLGLSIGLFAAEKGT
jgi:hypothetical protein